MFEAIPLFTSKPPRHDDLYHEHSEHQEGVGPFLILEAFYGINLIVIEFCVKKLPFVRTANAMLGKAGMNGQFRVGT